MKELEEMYGVHPADFCNNVPKILGRTHVKGIDSPRESLNDPMFVGAMEKLLTPEQTAYFKALIELVAEKVENNSRLRVLLANNEKVFDADEPFDINMLKKMYRIFT